MEIEIRKHHFKLLLQKAIFWGEAATLLISDLHLGKVTHFRKEGIAIPSAAYDNNFKRLDQMLSGKVQRIIFLGDLFHNKQNSEWDVFTEWRTKHSAIDMTIVLGNHDILPGRLFEENKITVHEDTYMEEQFIFAHHPFTTFDTNQYIFCGHIHPVFCLRSRGLQSMRLPCFVFDEMQAVLPSFGVFTGGYEIERKSNRRIYLIANDTLLEVEK